MESINGCTVISPGSDPGFLRLGPAEMDGAYVAEIAVVPSGELGPPVHFHPNTDEAFYIAEGEATFLLGDQEIPLTSGGFVLVPRGVQHTVWNSGEGLLRGLILISPGDGVHEFIPVEAA